MLRLRSVLLLGRFPELPAVLEACSSCSMVAWLRRAANDVGC